MPNIRLEHINYNGTTYDISGTTDVATATTSGLMSAADKQKLDSIQTGADDVSLANVASGGADKVRIVTIGINGTDTDIYAPKNTDTTYTLTKSGNEISLTSTTGATSTVTLNVATHTLNGLLTASDKTKLDSISANANNISFTPTITNGTTIGIIAIDGTDQNIYAPTYTGSGVISVTGTTISHNNSGVTAATYGATTTSDENLNFGESFGVSGFQVDATGHITSAGTHSVVLPSLSLTQTRSSGEKIATLIINGVDNDIYATGVSDVYSTTSTDAMSGVAVASAIGALKYAGSPEAGGVANKTMAIPYGEVDATSTSTVYTASVEGITTLANGVCVLLKNGVVTSTTGFTININNLGAKPVYNSMSTGTDADAPSRDTTIFGAKYTMLFVYSEDIVDGGGWICYRGYNSDNNTIGYQIRTNNSQYVVTDTTYRYRLLFTAATGTQWVPSNSSTSTNSTSARAVNQRPIDPFGRIVYYGYTTTFAAGGSPAATYLWDQYNVGLGYSFNTTGATLTLTAKRPVYIKCAPQTNGSAIIDANTPYVQALPNTEDGKIYIFLGVASSATAVELWQNHPVYYYKDGAIRLWTNAYQASLADVAYSGSYNDLTDKPEIPNSSVFSKVAYTATTTGGNPIGILTIDGVDKQLYSQPYTASGALSMSNRNITHSTSGANTSAGETASKDLDFNQARTFSVLRAVVDNYGHTTTLSSYPITIPSASASASYTTGIQLGSITLNGDETKFYAPSYPTASDLGLSQALKFVGFATSQMEDGQTTTPTVSGITSYTPVAGDVVIDENSHYEYVYTTANKWELLGGDGSYVVSGVDYDVTNTGTNAPSAVTISPQTTSIYSMTSTGSVANGDEALFTMSVSGEKLSFYFEPNTPTQVTLPGRSSAINAWTGYNTGVNSTYAAAQVFNPTPKTIQVN